MKTSLQKQQSNVNFGLPKLNKVDPKLRKSNSLAIMDKNKIKNQPLKINKDYDIKKNNTSNRFHLEQNLSQQYYLKVKKQALAEEQYGKLKNQYEKIMRERKDKELNNNEQQKDKTDQQIDALVTRINNIDENQISRSQLKTATLSFKENKKERLNTTTSIQNEQDQSMYYMLSLKQVMKLKQNNSNIHSLYKQHFISSFVSLKFIKTLKPVELRILDEKRVYLKRPNNVLYQKTVIFDMDETLIHCNENLQMPNDTVVTIKLPTGEIIDAGINVRDFAVNILKEMSKLCEVIVFTASHENYANKVLDYLDPENEYIHHRLFRGSCVQSNDGVHIKDLRIFADRNLKDLVLIDNAAYSYGFQIDNGIPIIPFFSDKTDTELRSLFEYLKFLIQQNDLRQCNRQYFKQYLIGESASMDIAINRMFG